MVFWRCLYTVQIQNGAIRTIAETKIAKDRTIAEQCAIQFRDFSESVDRRRSPQPAKNGFPRYTRRSILSRSLSRRVLGNEAEIKKSKIYRADNYLSDRRNIKSIRFGPLSLSLSFFPSIAEDSLNTVETHLDRSLFGVILSDRPYPPPPVCGRADKAPAFSGQEDSPLRNPRFVDKPTVAFLPYRRRTTSTRTEITNATLTRRTRGCLSTVCTHSHANGVCIDVFTSPHFQRRKEEEEGKGETREKKSVKCDVRTYGAYSRCFSSVRLERKAELIIQLFRDR